MAYDLVETKTEQGIYRGERTLYPWSYSLRKCREQQHNQNCNERQQYDYEGDPSHPDPVDDFVNSKLFVRKGRNLVCH